AVISELLFPAMYMGLMLLWYARDETTREKNRHHFIAWMYIYNGFVRTCLLQYDLL
ncbi:hypothetical protein ACJX0J_005583, partial [Zea mays]